MTAFARVEPLTSTRALKGPFDYRLPEAMADAVRPGSLLVVPFAGRKLTGVVTELSASTDVPQEKLAEPLELLAQSVPRELVGLGLWVAEQYCSTAARGLALVTPPGTGTGRSGVRSAPRTELVASLTDAGRAALGDAGVRLTDAQRAALEGLARHPDGLPSARAPELIGSNTAALRRLEGRGLVELSERQRRSRPEHVAVGALRERPPLTADQQQALAEITAAADQGFADLLLHGVTGSGKTEVYLGAAEHVLQAGRSVIVMVPEIALTPQLVTRFAARFGERVAVMHSQLTQAQRRDEWQRIHDGAAEVVIGPRSAVFAPVERLGLLVVDEEHDGSYKQESDPRYDARDVALERCEREQAVLLSGSATPRAESWQRSRRITLPSRVDGVSLPPVELLDMNGQGATLHATTSAALSGVAARGEKAVVLLNRRGWSNFLTCQDCGHTWICPNCDVTLVLHMGQGQMRCHHCGHREPLPESCPECGSVSIARHGSGTERMAHELREAVGSRTEVFRLDADTAAREGVVEVLKSFEDAPSGVLVGTQMVAKGHDFPDVTLGVVIDADATLNFPDFRSEERTFALVAQLAGRSGRGPGGGRVLVQTRAPENRALRHASTHDAAGFVEDELLRRSAFGYPPFGHVIRLQVSSEAVERAQAAADQLAAELKPLQARLLGPVPLFKRKGLERFQLELRSEERARAVAEVGEAVDHVARSAVGRGVRLMIDVDPH